MYTYIYIFFLHKKVKVTPAGSPKILTMHCIKKAKSIVLLAVNYPIFEFNRMSCNYKAGSPHVLSLHSFFNILYILIMFPCIHLLCFLVFISFLRQMIVLSLLFGELLHCHFCRYSLKQSPSTTWNSIPEKDQQYKRTIVFCILYLIPLALMFFLRSFMLREFSFLFWILHWPSWVSSVSLQTVYQ